MADSVLKTKSKEFAKSIVFLCRKLKQNDVEGALINQLLPPLEQMFTKHSMHKEQRTSSQSLKLHLKNAMRASIGLSYCMKQIA